MTTLPNIAAATTPLFISTTTLHSILNHETLITHLQTTLPTASLSVSTPTRHSHSTSQNSSLLLMPSFSSSPSIPYTGVKLVTSHPQNSSLTLPSIHACYALFSSITGQTLALFDATDLTLFRTSSVSALASSYLSNPNSEILVMVGSGNLSPHLITAHLSIRPSIKRVIIWNRTHDRAAELAARLRGKKEPIFDGVSFEHCGCLDEGERLKKGAHLNLVGSFKPSMMECDDEALRRGRVFVDNHVAMEEAGELVGAFERGVISKDDVCGSLVELIKGEKLGRKSESEITVFKSVGSGIVDLLTAQFVYETLKKDDQSEQH
ncbi:hypothetical protein Cgig2_007887 [Carnegiea gigantea]|uniref:Ornithine cyclodeaminase n=1 Tax=Carnegiea gigantea TaxID=171969 RepID=A0A9Q1QHK1_9CARY|nr:hypothetical protein Cgig2_007887 [Carnegiea gigantea]